MAPNNTTKTSDSEQDPSVNDDIAALERDADYIMWVHNIWQPLMSKSYGDVICQERAYLQWREQDGFCAATGHVLTGVAAGKCILSPAVVAVNPNLPTSEPDNCRIVAHYVWCMFDSVKRYNFTWNQFLRLVSAISDD